MNIKSITLTLFLALAAIPAFALLNGDGYYRIHNVHTGRYAYIVDNTGSINVQTTTIEAGAIELWPGIDATLYDPATVLYFEAHGDRWDVKSQTTGIYQMLGTYLGIYADPRNPGTYWAYGTKGSMTAYLWDANSSTLEPESWITNVANNSKPLCRNWYIDPIDNSTDNYFGILPTIIASDGNYAVWLADFSFSFASNGTTAYYVTQYDTKRNLAVYKQVDGNVPARTPVFIKCAGTTPAANKVNIGASAANVSGNILKPVWFNCKKYAHDNRVINNKSTMRVLSVLSDGKVGLKSGSFPTSPVDGKEALPRNSFYLEVPAGSPDEIPLVSEAEYQEIINRPIEAESVTLNTTSLTLTEGETAQLTATVSPDDTTDKTVTYTSSNPAVASVDNDGKVTAVSAGSATISASCGNVSATCQVTVKPLIIDPVAVVLDKTSIELTEGETAQLTATVLPANTTDKTVTYTSSDPAVATVDNNGKITAVLAGNTTITASCGNVSATCQVTVKPLIIDPVAVVLDKSSIELTEGETAQLAATVLPANTTDKTVTYTSSNPAVATVDNSGKITAVLAGNATIIASCGNVSATCQVTVKPLIIEAQSIALDKTVIAMKEGESTTLIATVSPANTTDKTVTFTSSDPSVATVDATGVIVAVAQGECDITATCGTASAVCHVSVSPNVIYAESIILNAESIELEVDETYTLVAVVSPADVTEPTVTFMSSDPDIASVDAEGEVVSHAGGEVVISATCGDAKAYCTVKVNKKAQQIQWNQAFDNFKEGDNVELTATATSGLKVDYTITSGADIAYIVDNVLYSLAEGTINVRATQAGDTRYNAAEPVEVIIYALSSIAGIDAGTLCVTTTPNGLNIQGADGATIEVYTVSGILVKRVHGGQATGLREGIHIPLAPGSIYIVKIGAKAFRVVL